MEFVVEKRGLGRGLLRILRCSSDNCYTIAEYSLSSGVGTLGPFVTTILFIYLFIIDLFSDTLSSFLHENSQIPLLRLDKKHPFPLEKRFYILRSTSVH